MKGSLQRLPQTQSAGGWCGHQALGRCCSTARCCVHTLLPAVQPHAREPGRPGCFSGRGRDTALSFTGGLCLMDCPTTEGAPVAEGPQGCFRRAPSPRRGHHAVLVCRVMTGPVCSSAPERWLLAGTPPSQGSHFGSQLSWGRQGRVWSIGLTARRCRRARPCPDRGGSAARGVGGREHRECGPLAPGVHPHPLAAFQNRVLTVATAGSGLQTYLFSFTKT